MNYCNFLIHSRSLMMCIVQVMFIDMFIGVIRRSISQLIQLGSIAGTAVVISNGLRNRASPGAYHVVNRQKAKEKIQVDPPTALILKPFISQ